MAFGPTIKVSLTTTWVELSADLPNVIVELDDAFEALIHVGQVMPLADAEGTHRLSPYGKLNFAASGLEAGDRVFARASRTRTTVKVTKG